MPRPWNFCRRTPGPATCANWKTLRKALLLAQDYTVNVDHVRAALDKERALARFIKQPSGEYH